MNRLLYSIWSLLLVSGLLITTSCNDDNLPNPPAFEVTNATPPSGSTLSAGESISFTVTVTAPSGLKSLVINKQGNGAEPQLLEEKYQPANPGGTTSPFVHEFSYTAMVADGGKDVVLNFVAEDNVGQQATYQYRYSVTEVPLSVFRDVKLYAPKDDQTSKTWFSTLRGETFSGKDIEAAGAAGDDISSGIDISYYFGDNLKATISSPDFYPKADFGQQGWESINATRLRNSTMTPAEFEQIDSYAQLEQAFNNGLTYSKDNDQNANFHQNRVMGLTKDKVVVFKTDPNFNGGSRYGAILVKHIEGTTRATAQYMQFDAKVMPIPAN